MSDTILGGDFTVYYEAENRQKRIEWTGSATGTRTANELYSALQDLFDELNQLDDGTPMSAQTPTEYTIGIIDTGDDDPWFIDRTSVEHLTGGALRTASWTRSTGSNTGIVKFDYTVGGGTDFDSTDIGLTVTHSVGGDSGTLLHFITDGSNGTAWVRPDTSAAANDWDSTGANVTVTGGTGASLSQDAAASTGESLWANIFTLGTIESNTHMYVEQNGSLLVRYDNASDNTDWWSDGQIDILVNVKEVDTEVDEGVIRVFARQHSKTYAFFEVDLSSGGRNPIPLQTGDDLNNTVGYRQMVLTTASADFTVGEIIQDDSDSTIQGIVTSNSGTAPNITLQYYLIGDPLNDFTGATGGFTGASSSSTATAVAPTDVNAATYTDVTVTHGVNETFDVDENDTTENYSIVIDCNNRTLQQVQERLKYITRRGETTTASTDGQQGQFYLGSDYRLEYDALTGTVSEGAVVTQVTSAATGTVVSHNTTDKIIILRNSRGTFDDTSGYNVEVDGSNYVTMTNGASTATAITPVAASPFGTFAGGKFFGAPGVVLDNVPSADATNYQLIDDNGNVVIPPNKVTVEVANTRSEDRIAVFRLTGAGGNINKTEYAGTVQTAGATTVVVGSAIATDVPGKSAGGVLRIVDSDANLEYRLRFSSWSASTFTLASTSSDTTEATTDTNTIVATGAFTNAKVGDLIRNQTRSNAISYITSITDNNTAEISPAITGQTTGDTFDINVLPVATTASDYVYIPIIDSYETTGTDASTGNEQATVTYVSDISVRVVARNSNSTVSTTTPMLPYTADATISSTGLTNNIIRTQDTIKT